MIRAMKWALFPVLFILVNVQVAAQNAGNYTVSTGTASSLSLDKNGNLLNLSANFNLLGTNNTTSNSSLVPINFDFVFMGKYYTHFIAGNDGQLALGLAGSSSQMLSATSPNELVRIVGYPPDNTNNAPVLAAFWDDLRTARTGFTVRFVVSGTAPFRSLTIQWSAVINESSATITNPADGVFQVRLYESTGEIEYVYGKMEIGTGSTTVTASIGFTSGNTDNSFVAVKDLVSFNTTTSVAEEPATRELVNSSVPGPITGLHSVNEGERRSINFLPAACNGAFTDSSVTNIQPMSMQLNWTDNITNKLGYLLYRSVTDSNNYQYITSLPASTTNYVASGLLTNTRYYWKVVPYTEGNTTLVLRLTDSTRCKMQGVYSIGPGGDFLNIRHAQDSLVVWGVGANSYWELLPTYTFSGESLPITFNKLPLCHNTGFTVTVRPAAGASFNVVNSSTVFFMDSTKNVIIDGRAGGIGPIALTLEGPGQLFRIRNGWQDTIRYVDIRSSTNQFTVSAVMFEGTTGGGSHHNTIHDCLLHDRGGGFTLPRQLIGGITSGTVINNYNSIIDCQLYNFDHFAIDAPGRAWKIAGNSFYATSPVTVTDTSGFINLPLPTTTISHEITGNYFGGSGAQCSGNTLEWNSWIYFAGIHTAGNAAILNNKFKRLKVRTSIPQTYDKVYVDLVRVGNVFLPYYLPVFSVRDNEFGAANPADSINITSGSDASVEATMVNSVITADASITRNTFQHIRTAVGNNTDMSLSVIQCAATLGRVDSNMISTNDHAYRIKHGGNGRLRGIYAGGNVSINHNTVTNTTSAGLNTGISSYHNFNQVTGNNISFIKAVNKAEGYNNYNNPAAIGIDVLGGDVLVSKNRIIGLSDSSSTANGSVTAIHVLNGYGTIDGNFIDGLTHYSTGDQVISIRAFNITDNFARITNNMVRMGVDTSGATIEKGLFTCYINNHACHNLFSHNTVYITGTNAYSASGLNGSSCVFWLGPSTFVNNILVNKRTYTSSVNLSTVYNPTTESQNAYIDYNVYDNVSSNFFAPSYLTFQAWKSTGRDPHSVLFTPNIINPEGPTRTLNLHVTGATPAERRGIEAFQYSTSEDFDGDSRPANSPVDVGADAGNFVAVDLDPPTFIVVPLADSPDSTSRYITIRVIDTLSGLRQDGNTRPTIWYRKSFPTTSPWVYSFGQLDSGTVRNGNWKFYINHQSISITEFGTDSVQYYFVAQDTTDYPGINVGISPGTGGSHTNVTTQVTPPATPYSYRVKATRYIIPPLVTVGTGQRYPTLTGPGGLFESITKDSVQTDITARIVSHLNEPGTWALDSLLTQRNLKLTIRPGHDSLFIIRSNANLSVPMIRLYNTDNLTIDGRFNDDGRWLRFINSHTSPTICRATIALYKASDSVLIRNAEIQNNGTSTSATAQGIVMISDGNCYSPKFINNVFSNITGSATRPTYGFYLNQVTSKSYDLVVSSNHFVNMDIYAILLSNNLDWGRIDSNHFYSTTAHSQTFSAIRTGSVSGRFQIKGNFIGGSAAFCGGTPWINSSTANIYYGMDLQYSGPEIALVENNTFRNIRLTNTSGSAFYCIGANGSGAMIINGNTIGDSTNAQSLELASSSNIFIHCSGRKKTVTNNLVSGINITSTSTLGNSIGIFYNGDSALVIQNNIISNIRAASQALFTNNGTLSGIYINNTSKNNVVEKNQIFNLTCTSTAAVQVGGIVLEADDTAGIVSRNRIYGLSLPNSFNGTITGIRLITRGKWRVDNNQVTITNGSSTNPVNMFGIYDSTTLAGTHNRSFYYNSILVGGAQSAGSTRSFSYYNGGNSVVNNFKNNLLLNRRAGGSGAHGAITVKNAAPATAWSPQTANYNLYTTQDTTKAFVWGNSALLSFQGWRSNSQTDTNSYIMHPLQLPSNRFFVDSSKGNLDINPLDSICWYVNGRGIPVSGMHWDHNQPNVRSMSIAAGPTDIGSDEFNTTTSPPPMRISGTHQLNGSDTLWFNGNIAAIITWGGTGTLPSFGNPRYYAGQWPNDTTNNGTVSNARYMSGYLTIPVTGGSNYTYSMKVYYSIALLGKVTDVNTMIINKRQPGTPGSWTDILPTVVNMTEKTMTITGQNSFSEFTGTDKSASLSPAGGNYVICPGASAIFNSKMEGASYQWQMNTGSGFIDITESGVFNGVNTAVLSLNNPPTTMYGYQFRCVVNAVDYSPVFTLRFGVNWEGNVSNAWEDPANWSCNIVPTNITDVIIPAGKPIYPQISSNTTIASLAMLPGSSVIVNPGIAVTIIK
ncbi:MAG: hypothetical protein JNM19_05955 [Chitinophagaceae bacterium]|nr:hypothetical protein [Chitinophagaceae bacterium]